MLGAIIAGLAPQIVQQLTALVPSLMPTLSSIIDRVIPDPVQAAQARTEIAQALAAQEASMAASVEALAKGANELNLADAQSGSFFKSGWRPSVGWICAAGTGYDFIARPVFVWLNGVVNELAGSAIPNPPELDSASLMTLLFGLLGLGGMRSFEKAQGVARSGK